jgi:hypothetical protein
MATFLRAEMMELLTKLNNSEQSIVGLSRWMTMRRDDARESLALWGAALHDASPAQRLTLLYVANDVAQTSRRTMSAIFCDLLAPLLVQAAALVHGDAKTKHKMGRMVQIWRERNVFSNEQLSAITFALDTGRGAAPRRLAGAELPAMLRTASGSSMLSTASDGALLREGEPALDGADAFSAEVEALEAALRADEEAVDTFEAQYRDELSGPAAEELSGADGGEDGELDVEDARVRASQIVHKLPEQLDLAQGVDVVSTALLEAIDKGEYEGIRDDLTADKVESTQVKLRAFEKQHGLADQDAGPHVRASVIATVPDAAATPAAAAAAAAASGAGAGAGAAAAKAAAGAATGTVVAVPPPTSGPEFETVTVEERVELSFTKAAELLRQSEKRNADAVLRDEALTGLLADVMDASTRKKQELEDALARCRATCKRAREQARTMVEAEVRKRKVKLQERRRELVGKQEEVAQRREADKRTRAAKQTNDFLDSMSSSAEPPAEPAGPAAAAPAGASAPDSASPAVQIDKGLLASLSKSLLAGNGAPGETGGGKRWRPSMFVPVPPAVPPPLSARYYDPALVYWGPGGAPVPPTGPPPYVPPPALPLVWTGARR